MNVWIVRANGGVNSVWADHDDAEAHGLQLSRVNGPRLTVLIEEIEVRSRWQPEHGDSVCRDCGTTNIVWFADNALWNLVVGGPGATDDPGGVVCVPCFDRRAQQAMGRRLTWKLVAE